jgi:hypothetical protein
VFNEKGHENNIKIVLFFKVVQMKGQKKKKKAPKTKPKKRKSHLDNNSN